MRLDVGLFGPLVVVYSHGKMSDHVKILLCDN